jgi:PncC family amidohydrolase
MNTPPPVSPALQVVETLTRLKAWLCSVESCTGGGVSDRITDVPGASAVFYGGWVTYDNLAKEALGIPSELLRRHGAVSAEVASLLAESGAESMEKTLGSAAKGRPLFCVATTGIAGPTGGTAVKPVGLCWIAVSRVGRPTLTTCTQPVHGYDRAAYKKHFAEEALRLILRACESV